MMRYRVHVLAGLVPVLATALLAPLLVSAGSGELQLVGNASLGGRGLNAGLALAGSCAYVGSRGQGPLAVIDVSDPSNPTQVGTLPAVPGSTLRELRAVEDLHLLVVLAYALQPGRGSNRIELFRWGADCRNPLAAGSYDFGTRAPHEFFLWRDPAHGTTVLLFVAMFGSKPDLDVLDVSEPAQPRLAGSWTAPTGMLHSISVDSRGRLAYLSLWGGGLAIGDPTDFTDGEPNPRLRLLTPPNTMLPPPPGGNVHSAVAVPDQKVVLLTDERYAPRCPYGPARTVDVSDPARPRQLGVLAVAENNPANCPGSSGTFTSHNPTLTQHLAFISWYSAGLQVFDLSNPGEPTVVAQYRPDFVQPLDVDRQLGAARAMTWSYPVLRNGLVYVVDINQGLIVLRYRGVYEDEVAAVAFADGSTNLARQEPPPVAVALPQPEAPDARVPTPKSPGVRSGAQPPRAGYLAALAVGLLAAFGLAALAVRRRIGSRQK